MSSERKTDSHVNLPLPAEALNHCLLLFERGENVVAPFLEAFADRFPGADIDPEQWASLGEPRPCAFGPVAWQRWRWHILFDLQGMPPQVAAIMRQADMGPQARDAVARHQTCAVIFLVGAPAQAQPGEQDRALARAAWAMLDAGAAVLIWPRTGLAWHHHELENLAPDSFDPHEGGD
jgi:hypothetical protein